MKATSQNQIAHVKTNVECGQPLPKFNVGDGVTLKKQTLYGETVGVVESVERVYKQVEKDGSFSRSGLATRESDIKHGCLPYRFDGETVEVEYPEHDFGGWIQKAHTMKSRFAGYGYTVRSEKMLTVYSESSLIKKSK